MPDETKDPKDLSPQEQLDRLQRRGAAEMPPRERFRKTSHIALLMAYDLIDKLRYWEKETLELPDDQIQERLEHLIASIEQLRAAYLKFADIEL